VLAEVKATGVGDNKNILLELNIEQTRHNEIQILGNGEWTIALGGRDCSLQMHEQKLVEVSVTREGLEDAIAEAKAAKNEKKAKALATDLVTLGRMEEQAERFGCAVKLDSASTFECIVDGDRHYFMEVNTRIQVEHRVSELCYALRFTNPKDPNEHFDVESLVEAMALIAKHKARLPKPERVMRERAAIEARLNATDRALNPAAGGVIVHWSDPIDGEIRDDQGICIKNPDTGRFMRYRLAGAYDSNVALLLATGASRRESWERLVEIFRRTTLRGIDLATNLEFHYGILMWFLARDPWAKPTTKFVVPYLTLVGQLAQEAQSIDLDYAFQRIARATTTHAAPDAVEATRRVLELKETLLERPMQLLVEEPHYLSAWLSQHHRDFVIEDDRVVWQRNPVRILSETYRLLHLDTPSAAAAHRIWDHDRDQLETALAFYDKVKARADGLDWPAIDELLRGDEPAFGIDADTWTRVRAAHAGHQLGLDILSLLPLIAEKVGFYDLKLEDDLTITIPERLLEPKLQDAMRKVLVPPPVTKSDEIVAAMGGTFYAQEAPTLPSFVAKGAHFEKGAPLYIIEVMKMFNKVHAPFAGTITDVLMPTSGVVVRKGQPLFKVTPDEIVVEEDPKEKAQRIEANTESYLRRLL
jgi:pyruvate carboxylase